MSSEYRVDVRNLDRISVLAMQIELDSLLPDRDRVVVDFSKLSRVEPLGMLMFGSFLKRWRQHVREARPDIKFQASGFETQSYPAHMGFFRMFGLDFGNSPDEASGGANYQPISNISFELLERAAAEQYKDVHEIIDEKSNILASVLVRQSSGDVVETLNYCIREIIRNSLEHAGGVSGVWHCAQYWPTRDEVEVAVLDEGIGIRASLRRNPRLSLTSDEEAINEALRPGVSGVAYKGAKVRRTDAWRNSGFGLYMTSKLASNHGEFFIGSGNHGVTLNRVTSQPQRTCISGTVISMRLRPSKLTALRDALATLRQNAGSETRTPDLELSASMSSQMLSRDF